MGKQDRALNYIEKRRSIRIRRSKLLQDTPGIEYKIAIGTEELEQAFELVTQQYVAVGLQRSDQQLRLTKYHLHPDTKVFIAIKKQPGEKDRVVGTVTLVYDSSMGLPMDEIYHNELKRLRITGLQLAEVIGLSVSPSESAAYNNIVMYLYKICLQYARMTHVHDLLCTVKQKHTSFYKELLLFEPIGKLQPYAHGNNQLAQGYRLNIQQADQAFKKVYSGMEFDADLHRFFFTDTPSHNRPRGEGDAMTPEQMRYFIEKRTRLLSSLSNRDKNILREAFTARHKKFAY